MSYRSMITYISFLFVCYVISTVKTNNKNKYKMTMFIMLLSYLGAVIITSGLKQNVSDAYFGVASVIALLPVCVIGFILSEDYLKIKDYLVIKAGDYEAETPSHEDFIKGYCTIKFNNESFKLLGMVYSNKKTIVIKSKDGEYYSVDNETFSFNEVVAQGLFIIAIGLYYTSIDVSAYVSIGALLTLSGTISLLRTKILNEKIDLFLSIMYAISFATALTGTIILLSNRM